MRIILILMLLAPLLWISMREVHASTEIAVANPVPEFRRCSCPTYD